MAQLIHCAACRAVQHDPEPEYCEVCLASPFHALITNETTATEGSDPDDRGDEQVPSAATPGQCPVCDLPTGPADELCQGCGASLVSAASPVAVVLPGGLLRELTPGRDLELGRDCGDAAVASSLEPYPGVSRRHARLRHVGMGVEIRDLGSTNGTFVDGVRITGAHVAPSDASVEVRLGAYGLIRLHPPGAPRPARTER